MSQQMPSLPVAHHALDAAAYACRAFAGAALLELQRRILRDLPTSVAATAIRDKSLEFNREVLSGNWP